MKTKLQAAILPDKHWTWLEKNVHSCVRAVSSA